MPARADRGFSEREFEHLQLHAVPVGHAILRPPVTQLLSSFRRMKPFLVGACLLTPPAGLSFLAASTHLSSPPPVPIINTRPGIGPLLLPPPGPGLVIHPAPPDHVTGHSQVLTQRREARQPQEGVSLSSVSPEGGWCPAAGRAHLTAWVAWPCQQRQRLQNSENNALVFLFLLEACLPLPLAAPRTRVIV